MKIRIKGNSVRYRLTKSEVEIFCREGRYEQTTVFNSQTFTYVLEGKANINALEADFVGNTITIYLPKKELSTWATSNRVGFSDSILVNDSESLLLLVEKDFTCLDNTTEDQSDNYPNPRLL